jgi:hypothetical protein
MTTATCYKCGENESNRLEYLYGYTICESCIKDLALFKDKTIKRHLDNFDPENYKRFNSKSYKQEIKNRIEFLEQDSISKKIKLLHVLDRLEHL